MCESDPTKPATDPQVLAALTDGHRGFLRFVERRVSNPAIAEEILQNAFVKGMEKGSDLKDGESAVAWFYRVLNNAIIDHYRHAAVEVRGRIKEAADALTRASEPDPDMRNAVCQCMGHLLPTLKAEYADVLQQVDLEERPLAEVAERLGITPNNATVRLHRARQALKKQLETSCGTCATHGCLDCSCGQ